MAKWLKIRPREAFQELQQHAGRCEELEAQQQRLRQELVKANEAHEKSAQQMAELQTRTRQAQELMRAIIAGVKC